MAWHLLRCWTRLSTCAAVPAHTYPAAAVVPSPLPHQKQYMNAFFFFFFFFSPLPNISPQSIFFIFPYFYNNSR